ncbi:MAG TPA: hypothetical protein VH583_19055 [Vicinamibacterales bacterium]|jgi:hypothetical protein
MRSTRRAILAIGAAIALCASWTNSASAQTGIGLLHDGDCRIRIQWPQNTDVSGFRLLINGQTASRVTRAKGADFVIRLAEPLRERDNIRVLAGTVTYDAVVEASSGPAVASCSTDVTSKYDDRSVFEASGFLGSVFDNFAPNVVGGYENPAGAAAATQVKSRFSAGVTAQYRLIGKPGDNYQLWLSSYTLHGLRTADVDCSVPDAPPICSVKSSTSDKFLYVLEHASTLEAHVDARFEFMTLQRESDLPIKLFAAARFGFLDLEGAPRVYNSNSLGAGILAPKGVFRGSLAQVAWGISEQFGSDPHWNRLKVNGLLAFDVVPSLKDQVEFWKRAAGSTRFFVEISVDRNLREGPDAVQTYVGVLFDLRQAFSGVQF